MSRGDEGRVGRGGNANRAGEASRSGGGGRVGGGSRVGGDSRSGEGRRASGASRAGSGGRSRSVGREGQPSADGGVSRASRDSQPSLRPASVASPKMTSRAAVLAIVVCAIALTLAYPVREYIADRRQIDQLAATNARLAATVQHMRAEARSLNSPAVIAQEARDELHMCFPSETCYEVIFPARPHGRSAAQRTASPWYGRLWESVEKADGTSTR